MLAEAFSEMADALLTLQVEIPDLSVYGYWHDDPSPPCLDVYQGNPFQDGAAFGAGENRFYFTVRARVGTADNLSAQQLLWRLLDPEDGANVERALAEVGYVVAPEGVSGLSQYGDDIATSERMIGCEWRVSRFL